MSDEEVDSTNTDPKYWEELLRKEGLSMSRGAFIPRINPRTGQKTTHNTAITYRPEKDLISVESKILDKKLGKSDKRGGVVGTDPDGFSVDH